MLLEEAMEIIGGHEERKYLVSFERIEGNCLVSDYFPDPHAGERGFDDYDKAVEIAKKFAAVTGGKTCNLHIVDSKSFAPVGSWSYTNR